MNIYHFKVVNTSSLLPYFPRLDQESLTEVESSVQLTSLY